MMKKTVPCLAIINDHEFLIGSPVDGSTEIVQVRIVKRYKEATPGAPAKLSASMPSKADKK